MADELELFRYPDRDNSHLYIRNRQTDKTAVIKMDGDQTVHEAIAILLKSANARLIE